MSRNRTLVAVVALMASLSAAARTNAGTANPAGSEPAAGQVREVTMEDAVSDPALVTWREEVLPGIRAFLAAEREALAALSAATASSGDPGDERERNRQCEERKLLGEREVALRQLAWAATFGREALADRLRARVTALEAVWPELPAAAARTYGTGATPSRDQASAAAPAGGSR